jgi:hypothetical protein
MLKAFAVLLFTAALVAAQAPGGTGATGRKATNKTAVKTTTAQPLTIPADAMANPNGSYSWTDKQGKRWIFVKTPFGVMKQEAVPPPSDSNALTGMKAYADGDKVRFERATPFGPMKWEKNKADLTDEERALLTGESAKQD